jgi:hypothetical protein
VLFICRGILGARDTGLVANRKCVTRLLVRADGVRIKIEVTPVQRG